MTAAMAATYAQERLYYQEFPLGDATLLDGPLKHARDLNIQTLLKFWGGKAPKADWRNLWYTTHQ